MNDRATLLNSIASTIQTYRAGEIGTPDAAHVDRWISQFPFEQQLPILQAYEPVIKSSFLTLLDVLTFLAKVANSASIAGPNPAEFWKKANFLNIQKDGVSQREMLKLFDSLLRSKHGLGVEECGSDGGPFVYLDDVMCNGTRVGTDLSAWILERAPAKAMIHVILLVTHTGGDYFLRKTTLKRAIEQSGKQIEFKVWHLKEIENTKYWRNRSDVLWPTSLPNDDAMQDYLARLKLPFEPRIPPRGDSKIFATEDGRQVLEQAFLGAGMHIRSQHASPKDSLKPLGFGSFGVGFGSTFATYRNCPNTAPLAIWWGEGAASGPLQWYPLLPRKTYSSPENAFKFFPS